MINQYKCQMKLSQTDLYLERDLDLDLEGERDLDLDTLLFGEEEALRLGDTDLFDERDRERFFDADLFVGDLNGEREMERVGRLRLCRPRGEGDLLRRRLSSSYAREGLL